VSSNSFFAPSLDREKSLQTPFGIFEPNFGDRNIPMRRVFLSAQTSAVGPLIFREGAR
jgi:hypothetical protein